MDADTPVTGLPNTYDLTPLHTTTPKRYKTARRALGVAVVAGAVCSWWFLDSAPYPYAQRLLLDLPLPYLSLKRLDRMLKPEAGERILEIGPGTGLQSLHTAPQLTGGGTLDIVDIQQEMLDHVMRRAVEKNIDNITPNLADAHKLPFDDGTFEAAYAVTALGEIPEPATTLSELHRVLRPGGRLVIGEFFDRHQIRLPRLIDLASEAGMRLEKVIGPPFAYYARLQHL